ncbi:MAG: Maf family protein [Bacillota bacterium]
MDIVLASASPRRKMLLEQLGLEFSIQPSTIDESKVKLDNPQELVTRLSYLKAKDVQNNPDEIVIAADTVVKKENEILEKPANGLEAKKMLKCLSGTTHQVVTGITIIKNDLVVSECEATTVVFRELSNYEIDNYIVSGEPLDKAGGYGIQGQAAVFVKKIVGCFYNVVGLSLYKLSQMMKELNLEIDLNG